MVPRHRFDGVRRAGRLMAVVALAATIGTVTVDAQIEGRSVSRRFTRVAIEAGIENVAGVPAGTPVSVATIAGPGQVEVVAALHQAVSANDVLALWVREGALFGLAAVITSPDEPELARIEAPRRFTHGGNVFVHVTVRYSGTGGQHEDYIVRIGPSGALEGVAFEQAPDWFASRLGPGEGVWKGALYSFSDTDLRFEFSIWNRNDGNCCPTAGRVRGTYRIAEMAPAGQGRLPTLWRMTVDQFVRLPADGQ